MAITFNKHSVQRLLSSTALIGALLFSNTLSVSAEETPATPPVEQQTVEVIPTEDKHETPLEEVVEEPVNEVEKEAATEVEESAPAEDATEVEVTEEESEEIPTDLEDEEVLEEPSDLEEDAETDETSEAETPSKNMDEESEAKDEELVEEETTEEESEEAETSEEQEEKTEDEEALEADETSEDEEDTDEDIEESAATFAEALSPENQQIFAPMMANFSKARVANINNGPVERINEATRDHIAATISRRGWAKSDVVFLVNGFKEADTLTGSPLARAHDAPILFTRDNVLPSVTLTEIQRLGASKVIILGGNTSVPQHIVDTLTRNNLAVERINGDTRYDLASNIAKNVMDKEGTQRDAFLVNGDAFADAISIAPVAANKRLPIFLTRANELHATVRAAIPYVNSWNIIGGLVSIPNKIVDEMKAENAKISTRIAGENRYEVNRNIIQHYGNKKDYAYVASGEVVSDALATSVLAGKEAANILLVKDNNVGTLHAQTEFIKEKHKVDNFVLVGGERTLSKMTENHFVEPIVYLDAGHGSSDTGAYYGGVAERDINLSVSKKIQSQLNDYGYKVIMSRTTRNNSYSSDRVTDLYARPKKANEVNADIYVSVHHDAMPGNSSVAGLSTFYYQPKSQYPPLPENEHTHDDPTRLNNSRNLANVLQNELIKATGANNRGVRRGAFVVTREAQMPAVLLELGFMTNPAELRRIQTNSYQNSVAGGVLKGINRYFKI